uniref:Family with sequence similarity 110 member C n=1 Tax=Hippocampus comes TaxID=109280 RepID=A0A3Q3DDR7_HIPCM
QHLNPGQRETGPTGQEGQFAMESPSETSKILEKGPDYLRKQMELESEVKGPMSAVERLAASKPKYVKSQQVVNSTQEPLISLPSASSSLSSNWSSTYVAPARKSDPTPSCFTGRNVNCCEGPAMTANITSRVNCFEAPRAKQQPYPRRLRRKSTLMASGPKETSTNLLNVPVRRGKGVGRSRSDISSRYSKNFADFDSFFKYCGLDGEVIESLGKENFSARSDEMTLKVRSVSVATSDGGFSRNSDDSEGLQEDVLHKKIRQGTSVIERNARIIKWLYSCKNAKESGKKLRDLD